MSNTHQDALPQHIPGHDARHGSTDHSNVAPGEIAIGVIIGRASEYFDFFVYGIASVLVFPAVFFPFARSLEGTLYAFTIFAFAFIGRAFFFATLFLTAWRLAFATGRFLDLLFFAMVTLLLEIVRTRCESSPEKVCCHLCVTLESVTRIA